MAIDRLAAERAIGEFLQALGLSEHAGVDLSETPRRVVEAYADDLLQGYAVDLERLMEFLGRRGMPVLAHLRDASEEQIARWTTPTLRIAAEPIDLAALLPGCAAVVTHGGQGILNATLLIGRPLLLLPLHTEQFLNARQVAELGAATFVGIEPDIQLDYASVLEPLLSDPRFAAAAARHS